MRFSKKLGVLLSLTLLIRLLAGCAAPADTTDGTTTTTSTTTTTATTTTTMTASSADDTTSTSETTSTTTSTESADTTTSTTASTTAPTTGTTKPQSTTSTTKTTTTTKATTTTTKATSATLAPITPSEPYKVALSDERLHYEGRTMIENDSVKFDWTGTGMTMQVQGGDVRIKLTSNQSSSSDNVPYFAVYINGKRKKTLTATSSTMWHTIASNLPANRYTTVSILKLSEARNSAGILSDIELTGVLGPKPTLPERKMLILGDSITCGWGTLSTNTSDKFTTGTQDGSLTYPWLLADRFNAQKHILSVSGNGLATSNTGSTTSCLLPQQLPFVHYEADYSGPQWDHSSYQPDLILVGLGTNDIYGKTTDDRLANGVKSFCATLRETYPNATIVWVYGLMTPAKEAAIRGAAEEVAKTDKKVHYLHLDRASGDELGAGYHPNYLGHDRAADDLEPQIREIMGWND